MCMPQYSLSPSDRHRSEFIYRAVRSVDGRLVDAVFFRDVVNGSWVPANTPVPLLGKRADYYLATHGYTADAIRWFYDIHAQVSNANGFVHALAKNGMPMEQAQYLYNIIKKPEIYTTYMLK